MRIEYDTSPEDIVDLVNADLKKLNIEFFIVDSGDGYIDYSIRNRAKE